MQSNSLVSSRSASSPAVWAVSRWVLGTAGILWVAIAASLCGCSPISPVNGWVMNESGKSYYKRGEYANARREFERALMDRPHSPDYAFNVAAAMDQQGDHLAAEKMYRHALTLDPGHQPAYHGMAAMLMEEGRTAEANDLVNTWAATQPYSPEAATELGWLKGEQGDLDGADSELRRALRQNPRHSRALKQLGRVHGKSGRRGEAAADYARSLFMDPEQPDAQAELASLGSDVYGSPALLMAAAMPMYDPTLQASAYPAFTSPHSQLAGHATSDPNWSGSQAGLPVATAPMGFSMNPAQGMVYSPPTGPATWSQSPAPLMNGQQTYPTSAYPNTVAVPNSSPQFYNAARPTTTFFQPQQSFHGSPPGDMLSSTPHTEMLSSYPTQASFHDAPTWNSGYPVPSPVMVPGNNGTAPSVMNASFGNTIPAGQISAVPVVPAF